MSRNPLYQFVDTDTTKLEAALVDAYEVLVGHSAQPSSPERIFIAWVASIILQERVYLNHAGNQNIPSPPRAPTLTPWASCSTSIRARPRPPPP